MHFSPVIFPACQSTECCTYTDRKTSNSYLSFENEKNKKNRFILIKSLLKLFILFSLRNDITPCLCQEKTKNTNEPTLVLFTFICYSVYANRRNGEQCSTEEMLTYMYHNEEFSGHIIVRTTTCIQRCCFVQNPSVAQNVANDDALQI